MKRRNLSQISVAVALLLAKVFQRLVVQFQKFPKLHGYFLYNSFMEKSRKKREPLPGLKWYKVLAWMRNKAQPHKLTQEMLSAKMGYVKGGRSSITLLERGYIAPTEKQIRNWVSACGYQMETFYTLLIANENEGFSPKKSPK